MLKNLNEMKKADVITIHNGIIQAINGPIAYRGYLRNFDNCYFSVDAEILATALKDLDEDFIVRESEDNILIFDEEREISFVPKTAEQLLIPPKTSWYMRDMSHMWQLVDKFVTPQYPGIKVTNTYFETISDQSILRVKHHLPFENEAIVFARCKIPTKVIAYCVADDKLWLQYDDSNFIIINSLDIAFPNTDSFFTGRLRYKPIPNLKSKLLPCDKVKFENNNLILYKEYAAKAIIENIEGIGAYDFKLFSKVINHASAWQMTDTALFFSGENFSGVIENVEHSSV